MPSFHTHQLRNAQVELTLLPEYGCSWSALRIFLNGEWTDLLKPLFGEAPPFHYGSYLMAPWSNRIVQGVFEFEGARYRLRKNFPDDTAIHGDVRNRPWNVSLASQEKFEASLDSHEFPDFNYPFHLRFQHTLELVANRLRMAVFIENADQKRAPVGIGFHPFFKRCLSARDQDVMLVLPAESVYLDDQYIPTGPRVSVSRHTDLRGEKYFGNPNLDHCFTDLTGNLIRLIYSGSKIEVRYEIDSIFSHVVVYTPQDGNGRAKDFVAVEPVTHVTNGFNFYAKGWKGTGVKVLEPGELWGGSCTLTIVE